MAEKKFHIDIVQDGEVKFNDYGVGTFDDPTPSRLLGVALDGSVVEYVLPTEIAHYAKVSVGLQQINNAGAVLNPVTFAAIPIQSPGSFALNGTNDGVIFNTAGDYEILWVADFFDDNSARVAHRAIFNVNGSEVSRLSGSNYMRDSTAHDDASSNYADILNFSAGDIFSIDMQTTSSTANTTDLTASSRLLIKRL